MKTYKKLGLKMTRAGKNLGWFINGVQYSGNKGIAFTQWLQEHAMFKNEQWQLEAKK